MAVYRLNRIMQVPIRYLAQGGSEAAPDAEGNFPDDNLLAVDERGNPANTWKIVSLGTVAYTDKSDYSSLSEEDAAHATYSPFPAYFAEQERFEFDEGNETVKAVSKLEDEGGAKKASSSKGSGSTKKAQNRSSSSSNDNDSN